LTQLPEPRCCYLAVPNTFSASWITDGRLELCVVPMFMSITDGRRETGNAFSSSMLLIEGRIEGLMNVSTSIVIVDGRLEGEYICSTLISLMDGRRDTGEAASDSASFVEPRLMLK
jgi:hypothetical protein